jgi:hypothetical protein
MLEQEMIPELRDYWLEQLEFARRKVAYAERMLGILVVNEELGNGES